MTTEEKIKALVSGVCEQMPGIKPIDLEKRTPQGTKVRQAIMMCARRIAAESGDKEFLAIARSFGSQMSTKPIGGFETK